jgi:DNA-binding winged helix-turn-helix (wHTH) protein
MESKGSDLPVLIGQSGPLNGKKWTIETVINIGRDENCEIMIPDRQVSRFHARLTLNTEGVLFEDLASKNGTFRNGENITEPVFLQDGDLLQIALIQYFVFLSSDSTLPLSPIKSSNKCEGLYLDKKSRRVWVNQNEILPPLSAPQFRLLETLYDQEGNVIPRQDLINTTWGEDESIGVSEQALDALIRRLRDRLQPLDPDHEYIITVRGHGLRLENRQ